MSVLLLQSLSCQKNIRDCLILFFFAFVHSFRADREKKRIRRGAMMMCERWLFVCYFTFHQHHHRRRRWCVIIIIRWLGSSHLFAIALIILTLRANKIPILWFRFECVCLFVVFRSSRFLFSFVVRCWDVWLLCEIIHRQTPFIHNLTN